MSSWQKGLKPLVLIILLLIATLATWIAALKYGTLTLSWHDLLNLQPGSVTHTIVVGLRLPRVLAAWFVGMGLGACGLVLQSILQNPLAEPYTLGLSGGASLGAVTALILLPAATLPLSLPALSVGGCVVASAFVIFWGARLFEDSSRGLILFGLMISLFLSSISVAVLTMADPTQIQSALFWLMGQFGSSRDVWIYRLWPWMLAAQTGLWTMSASLDRLMLGDLRAHALGINPRRIKISAVFICTVLTALGVSLSGLIGFIGLVSPHLARRITKTSQHKWLIVIASLTGGLLLLIADLLARSFVSHTELPAGSLSAIIGAPLLMFLMVKHARTQSP